jgi:hypothetical protein
MDHCPCLSGCWVTKCLTSCMTMVNGIGLHGGAFGYVSGKDHMETM